MAVTVASPVVAAPSNVKSANRYVIASVLCVGMILIATLSRDNSVSLPPLRSFTDSATENRGAGAVKSSAVRDEPRMGSSPDVEREAAPPPPAAPVAAKKTPAAASSDKNEGAVHGYTDDFI